MENSLDFHLFPKKSENGKNAFSLLTIKECELNLFLNVRQLDFYESLFSFEKDDYRFLKLRFRILIRYK